MECIVDSGIAVVAHDEDSMEHVGEEGAEKGKQSSKLA